MLRRLLTWVFLLLIACKPNDELRIIFGGDVMLDRGVRRQINAHGVDYLMKDLQTTFRESDFSVVNLECAVTKTNSPLTKKFVFRGEPEWLPALKSNGITHAIVANNHSYDHGRQGLVSTAENLRAAGIDFVGYGGSQNSACEPVLMQKNGIKVALFSSVLLGLEGWMYLREEPGMCQASVDELAEKITAFKRSDPDAFAVITLHWGNEYELAPPILQRAHATKLIRAGADAIIGHHPHVVQRFEWIDGKPVFYSVGNLLFDNPNELTHDGILVRLVFHDKTVEPEVIPYRAEHVKPLLMADSQRVFFVTRWQQYSDSLPKIIRK